MAEMTDPASLEQISAFLDDELGPDERTSVEELLRTSDEARAIRDRLQRTIATIRSIPEPRLREDEAERLDDAVHATVAAEAPGPTPRTATLPRRRRSPMTYFAAAAVIAAIVGFGIVLVADNLTDTEPPPVDLVPTTSTSPTSGPPTSVPPPDRPDLSNETELTGYLEAEILPALAASPGALAPDVISSLLPGCTLPEGFEPAWIGEATWRGEAAVLVAGRFLLAYDTLVVAVVQPGSCDVLAAAT